MSDSSSESDPTNRAAAEKKEEHPPEPSRKSERIVRIWGDSRLKHGRPVRLLAFHPEGSLRIVERRTGVARLSSPGLSGVLKGVVSRDGRFAAVVNTRHPIDLWNLETGEYNPLMPTWWEADIRPKLIGFTPDGRHALTANANGTLYAIRL